MKTFFIALLTLVSTHSFASCPDKLELLHKMKGEWVAEGTREYTTQKKKISIRAFTLSTIESGQLKINETQWIYYKGKNNPPQKHSFKYWMSSKITPSCKGSFRRYVFVNHPNSKTPSFYGLFDGFELLTVENISSELLYVTSSQFFNETVMVTGRLFKNEDLVMIQTLNYKKSGSHSL